MDKNIASNIVSMDEQETVRHRTIHLTGSMTLNKKEFRIDDEIIDQPFISIKFMDDGLLDDEFKEEIGAAVLGKLRQYFTT